MLTTATVAFGLVLGGALWATLTQAKTKGGCTKELAGLLSVCEGRRDGAGLHGRQGMPGPRRQRGSEQGDVRGELGEHARQVDLLITGPAHGG